MTCICRRFRDPTALHPSTARISLSIASYFAGLAAGQLFYGPLLDRFGRKLPLYAGLVLFIAASLLCLCSRTVEWLIAMRFVQAVGGCAAQVAGMAMVRDFFPAKETAKIISLLILILSVSPLLAPSVGVFVSVHLGWQWVFIVLAAFVVLMLAVSHWLLPQGHQPDRTVSLRLRPILHNYTTVLKEPQFTTYALAGAFAFSGLLVYVASSPIIFMEVFHVSPQQFGAIFAGLSVGFIGSNQINVLLLRKFSSEQIFRARCWWNVPWRSCFWWELGWFGLAGHAGAVVYRAVQPRPGFPTRPRWRWCRSTTTSAAPPPCWAFYRSAWPASRPRASASLTRTPCCR